MPSPKIEIDVRANSGFWEQMDAARRKTGGWWANVTTLRVRIIRMDNSGYTLELNIRDGEVHGIRILDLAPSAEAMLREPWAPRLLWKLPQMLELLERPGIEVSVWEKESDTWPSTYLKTVFLTTTAFSLS